jgi:hypothetical protein
MTTENAANGETKKWEKVGTVVSLDGETTVTCYLILLPLGRLAVILIQHTSPAAGSSTLSSAQTAAN